jgi:hypothetical protein
MSIGCINQQPSFKGAILVRRGEDYTPQRLFSDVSELCPAPLYGLNNDGYDYFVFRSGDGNEQVAVDKLRATKDKSQVKDVLHIRNEADLRGLKLALANIRLLKSGENK